MTFPIRANSLEKINLLNQKVKKTGGSFEHTGTVVSVFRTTEGKERIVLEFDEPVKGMLHIYRPDQVEPIKEVKLTKEDEKQKWLVEFQKLVDECSVPNWDGYGANSIGQNSLNRARDFIENLPADIPLPEASVDPDGDVSFSWKEDKFCLGFSDHSSYIVWISGNKERTIHRTVNYSFGEIPAEFVSKIKKFLISQ